MGARSRRIAEKRGALSCCRCALRVAVRRGKDSVCRCGALQCSTDVFALRRRECVTAALSGAVPRATAPVSRPISPIAGCHACRSSYSSTSPRSSFKPSWSSSTISSAEREETPGSAPADAGGRRSPGHRCLFVCRGEGQGARRCRTSIAHRRARTGVLHSACIAWTERSTRSNFVEGAGVRGHNRPVFGHCSTRADRGGERGGGSGCGGGDRCCCASVVPW